MAPKFAAALTCLLLSAEAASIRKTSFSSVIKDAGNIVSPPPRLIATGSGDFDSSLHVYPSLRERMLTPGQVDPRSATANDSASFALKDLAEQWSTGGGAMSVSPTTHDTPRDQIPIGDSSSCVVLSNEIDCPNLCGPGRDFSIAETEAGRAYCEINGDDYHRFNKFPRCVDGFFQDDGFCLFEDPVNEGVYEIRSDICYKHCDDGITAGSYGPGEIDSLRNCYPTANGWACWLNKPSPVTFGSGLQVGTESRLLIAGLGGYPFSATDYQPENSFCLMVLRGSLEPFSSAQDEQYLCSSCDIISNDGYSLNIAFDCSNLLTGDCVGFDMQGNCINNFSPTIPPRVPTTPPTTGTPQPLVYRASYAVNEVSIPDSDVTGAAIAAAIAVPDNVVICDVDVMVNVQHTYSGDLGLVLYYPQSFDINATLAVQQCGGDDNLVEYFDDEAFIQLGSDVSCQDGGSRVQPVTPLSVFDGLSSFGVWYLGLFDLEAGDTGYLSSWELIITPCSGGNPPSPTPLPTRRPITPRPTPTPSAVTDRPTPRPTPTPTPRPTIRDTEAPTLRPTATPTKETASPTGSNRDRDIGTNNLENSSGNENDDDNDNMVPIIAGAVGGAAVLILLIVGFVLYRKKAGGNGQQEEQEDHVVPQASSPPANELSAAVVTGAVATTAAAATAPPSQVQQIGVVAPPGRLGLSITPDEKNGNKHTVNTISSESPLVGQVQEGDVVVSVDGTNVGTMTSTELLGLIGSKSEAKRAFVLERSVPAQEGAFDC